MAIVVSLVQHWRIARLRLVISQVHRRVLGKEMTTLMNGSLFRTVDIEGSQGACQRAVVHGNSLKAIRHFLSAAIVLLLVDIGIVAVPFSRS